MPEIGGRPGNVQGVDLPEGLALVNNLQLSKFNCIQFNEGSDSVEKCWV